MKILVSLLLASSLFGQIAGGVYNVDPFQAPEVLYFRDGSNNLEYTCTATNPSLKTVFARTVAASQPPIPSSAPATLTSIVDSSNTSTVTTSAAHGLAIGHRIIVSGATGDTDLNGTYTVATVPSSTTFTITTASVTDATYNEATLTVTTTAPRTNLNIWLITKSYWTSSYIDRTIFAYGQTARNKACDSRTSYF